MVSKHLKGRVGSSPAHLNFINREREIRYGSLTSEALRVLRKLCYNTRFVSSPLIQVEPKGETHGEATSVALLLPHEDELNPKHGLPASCVSQDPAPVPRPKPPVLRPGRWAPSSLKLRGTGTSMG